MSKASAQIKQALKEDMIKLKLEKPFRKEIKSIFSMMANDFKTNVAFASMPLGMATFESYRSDWKSILNRHYLRVQNAFKNMVVKEQEIKQDDDDDMAIEEDILGAMLLWRQMQSEQAASRIMDTNEKNMRESLLAAQEQLSEEDKPIDSRSIAALSVVLLRRKFKKRVNIIAEYETQRAAEKAKITEAQVLSGTYPGGRRRTVKAAFKTWRTMRDDRVRPSPFYKSPPWVSHRKAEGQRKRVDEPFIVSGERLMFPGDESLGATFPNLVRCRCVAIYEV